MSQKRDSIGVCIPEILLPAAGIDMERWACVACDQYTSQPNYWERVEQYVGQAPSTLRLMLPEIYLGCPGEAERIEAIRQTMREYLENGVLQSRGEGMVYLERTAAGRMRRGVMLALDLERYDYRKGSQTLIRATEGTIPERIPPRLRVRRGAALELPHILVLIDDPAGTVIEPLAAQNEAMEPLYDTDLMEQGGHIRGWMLRDDKTVESVLDALEALTDPTAENNLLFALGDGNHSFATAKASWEELNQSLTPAEQVNHPARYALVEIENLHDPGIVFEPIHRVLFGVQPQETLTWLREQLTAQNAAGQGPQPHKLTYVIAGEEGKLTVPHPVAQLEVGTLQNALDAYLAAHPTATVDYIHGDDVVRTLSRREDAIGFLLPPMEKAALFPTVRLEGALPRKTFSMGEAFEKRFYMECRRIEAKKN